MCGMALKSKPFESLHIDVKKGEYIAFCDDITVELITFQWNE